MHPEIVLVGVGSSGATTLLSSFVRRMQEQGVFRLEPSQTLASQVARVGTAELPSRGLVEWLDFVPIPEEPDVKVRISTNTTSFSCEELRNGFSDSSGKFLLLVVNPFRMSTPAACVRPFHRAVQNAMNEGWDVNESVFSSIRATWGFANDADVRASVPELDNLLSNDIGLEDKLTNICNAICKSADFKEQKKLVLETLDSVRNAGVIVTHADLSCSLSHLVADELLKGRPGGWEHYSISGRVSIRVIRPDSASIKIDYSQANMPWVDLKLLGLIRQLVPELIDYRSNVQLDRQPMSAYNSFRFSIAQFAYFLFPWVILAAGFASLWEHYRAPYYFREMIRLRAPGGSTSSADRLISSVSEIDLTINLFGRNILALIVLAALFSLIWAILRNRTRGPFATLPNPLSEGFNERSDPLSPFLGISWLVSKQARFLMPKSKSTDQLRFGPFVRFVVCALVTVFVVLAWAVGWSLKVPVVIGLLTFVIASLLLTLVLE